ncbi:hypothetical protein SP5_066_00220, partial [Sphingomonas parapaucimobilis NBRC 15100]
FDKAMDGDASNASEERRAKPFKPPVAFAEATEPHNTPKRPTVPLLATFEAYAAEQRIKPGTAAEWRSMLKALVAFVGHDDANALTVSDIDEWRDALLSKPGRGGRLRSPGTVKDKYLCAVRATLAWAVEKRLLPDNVASLVKVRVPKKVQLRERDFTQYEAMKILSATFQLTCPPFLHPGGTRDRPLKGTDGMKRKQFSEEQIIGILKEAEAGAVVTELCRKHGISSATYYAWKAKFGGLEVSDAKRLRSLEEENARLKRLLADTMLDNAGLKDLLSKKW